MNRNTLVIAIVAVAGASRTDASEMGLYAVGASGGYSNVAELGGTFGFGVHADLGELAPNLSLFPSITYWSKSDDLGQYSGITIKARTQEVGVQADLHYYMNPEASTNWYLGAGAGVFVAKESLVGDYIVDVEEELSKKESFGISVLGGFEAPISDKARLVTEARYKVDGHKNAFRLGAGLTFELQ